METQAQAKQLWFHYTDENGERTSPDILKDISLSIDKGDFVALLGLWQVNICKTHERHPAAVSRYDDRGRHRYKRRVAAFHPAESCRNGVPKSR